MIAVVLFGALCSISGAFTPKGFIFGNKISKTSFHNNIDNKIPECISASSTSSHVSQTPPKVFSEYMKSFSKENIPSDEQIILDQIFKDRIKLTPSWIPVESFIGDVNTHKVASSLYKQSMIALKQELDARKYFLPAGNPHPSSLHFQSIVGHSGFGKTFGSKSLVNLLNHGRLYNVSTENITSEYIEAYKVDSEVADILKSYSVSCRATYITFNNETNASEDSNEWNGDLECAIVARILYSEMTERSTNFAEFISHFKDSIQKISLQSLVFYLKQLFKVDFYHLVVDDGNCANAYNSHITFERFDRDCYIENRGYCAILEIICDLKYCDPMFLVTTISTTFSTVQGFLSMNNKYLYPLSLTRFDKQDIKSIYDHAIKSNPILQKANNIEKRKVLSIVVSCGRNPKFLNIICKWLSKLVDIGELDAWREQLSDYNLSLDAQYELLLGNTLTVPDADKWHYCSGFLDPECVQHLFTTIPVVAPALFDDMFNLTDSPLNFKKFITRWIHTKIKALIKLYQKCYLSEVFYRKDYDGYVDYVDRVLPHCAALNNSCTPFQAYNNCMLKNFLGNTLDISVDECNDSSDATFEDKYGINTNSKECQIINTKENEPGFDGLVVIADEKLILAYQEKSYKKEIAEQYDPIINFSNFTESIILTSLNLYPFLHDNWTVGYLMFNTRSASCPNAAKWFNDTQAASEEEEEGRLAAYFEEATLRLLSSDSMISERYKQFIAEYAGGDAVQFVRLVSAKALDMFKERSSIVNPSGLRVMLGGQAAFVMESYQALAEDHYYQ